MSSIYEFAWTARNRFGQKQRGKQLAITRNQLETKLIQQGFQKIKISRNFILPTRPKQEEITQLVNQLGLLINSGLPLRQSLNVLLDSTLNIKCYMWIHTLLQHIEKGFSFSTALEKEGKYISSQEIQLIKIGEQSGKFAELLTTIVQNRTKSEQLQKKVKKILFYPTMILSISLILSTLLLLFIVPKFADLYHSKDNPLPLITELLFYLSSFLQTHLYTLIFTLFFIYIVNKFAGHRLNLLSFLKQKIVSKIPIFSQIIHYSRLIFFCQNSALMLRAHLRLEHILTSFSASKESDPVLRAEMPIMLERLKQGYRFSESLNPNLFPFEMIQMIAVGEKSGQLAQILSQISEMYRQKLDYRIDLLSQLLEPMLMVIMGFIVGTILIGLYLPIFDMGAMIE